MTVDSGKVEHNSDMTILSVHNTMYGILMMFQQVLAGSDSLCVNYDLVGQP